MNIAICWQVTHKSIAVLIPQQFVEKMKIKSGDMFYVSCDEKKNLVFRKIDEQKTNNRCMRT